MKKDLILILLFLFIGSAHLSNASTQAECPRKLESYSNLQIHQSLSSDRKKCYLSIHPRDAFETLIYRDYLFTSDGLLLIFNSLNPDEGPDSSGAREFFFFEQNFTGYSWKLVDQKLVISGFNNLNVTFSIDSAQITKIDGAEVQVAKEVTAKNKGGVEFLNTTWPYLDSGFAINNAPSANPKRSSVLINKDQQKCLIQNQLLFIYNGDDPELRSKAEIQKISARRCSGFILSEPE